MQHADHFAKKRQMRSALHHASVADGTFEPRPGPTAALRASQDWKNHRPLA